MSRKEQYLKTYSIALIFLAVCGLYPLLVLYSLEDRPPNIHFFVIFLAAVGCWYLTTGIGILLRTKWGYFFLKSFLYFLLLWFPIGTFIAYASLKYMKKNHIKTLFGFGASGG